MKIIKLLFVLLLMSTILPAQEIKLMQIASGFSQPVDIKNAGDERLFIVERAGRIKIIDTDGTILPTSFLDIVSQASDDPNERGLLGLEFHPDYANNGYFYVNYTKNNGDTRISRFSVDPANPNLADPNSELTILEIAQPFWNHNAGGLEFGPDGYLYIGTGDGGSGGDPGNRAQNPQNLLGKMLRIDVDNGTPYAIPPDNPFVSDENTLDEIWAIGLRNPWRYSFDRETGDFWIGDVGQNALEEIDFEPANSGGGFNYGWRCYEGDATYNTSGCGNASDYRAPLLDYSHNGMTHCSVTGGFVYRGCEAPGIIGHYVYADYCSGRFWSIVPDDTGGWNDQEIGNLGGYDISTFGEDVNGELYAARLTQGRIYKIGVKVEIEQTDSVTLSGPGGYANYQWYLDGIPIENSNASSIEFSESGNYTIEVSSANGCSQTSDIFIATVAIEDLQSFESFTVNPNPFSKELILSMEVNTSTDVTIQVLDVAGKILQSKSATVAGTSTETLNLQTLASGIYFINLVTEEGTVTRKVVKD